MIEFPKIGGKDPNPRLDCRICTGSTYCCYHATIDPGIYASTSSQDHEYKRVICTCGSRCRNKRNIRGRYELRRL